MRATSLPWEDRERIRANDLRIVLSGGSATLNGFSLVEWPASPPPLPPAANSTSGRRLSSAASTPEVTRQAIELYLDGTLNGDGQQIFIGAKTQATITDMSNNRMGDELTLAGLVSDGMPVAAGGILGNCISMATSSIALIAGGSTFGCIACTLCCFWCFAAIARWRRRRKQAKVVKEHVKELKRLITAAPADGGLIRDAEELERLITAPSKVQSAKDLLSKVTAHVETKQATMIPHVFHCTRCSGCNTFAPVCQEAHVHMFGLMASDHLDAMRWMKGLFEEKEVPIERFDLTKLPASVALAAFSFDESVFTQRDARGY